MLTARDIDKHAENMAEYLVRSLDNNDVEELVERSESILSTCANTNRAAIDEFFEKSIKPANAITQEIYAQVGLYSKLFTAFQLGAYIATLEHKKDVDWVGGPSDEEQENSNR